MKTAFVARVIFLLGLSLSLRGQTNPGISFAGIFLERFLVQGSSNLPEPDPSPFGFLSFVDLAEQSAITGGSLAAPNGDVVEYELEEASLDIEEDFSSESELKTTREGTFQIRLRRSRGGTSNLDLTLNAQQFPPAPHLANFQAAQSIDPGQPFTLQWSPIPGGSVNDFVILSIDDLCDHDDVFETPDFGEPGALNGTMTQVTIPANTLRPGRQYEIEINYAKFGVIDQESVPGATLVSGAITTVDIPIHTSGNEHECQSAFLHITVNYPLSNFGDGTTPSVNFQQGPVNFEGFFSMNGDDSPPGSVTFTGPAGSGLNSAQSIRSFPFPGGTGFASPQVLNPAYPPSGVYSVNYEDQTFQFDKTFPGAAQQIWVVPTVILDANRNATQITWKYHNSSGDVIPVPSFVDELELRITLSNNFQNFRFPRSATSYVFPTPVSWDALTQIQTVYWAENSSFTFFWQHDVRPVILTTSLPGGIVGQSYLATLEATAGYQPYNWALAPGEIGVPGLFLNQDGQLSGTPAQQGRFTFRVRVVDFFGQFAERELEVLIGDSLATEIELKSGSMTLAASLGNAAPSAEMIQRLESGDTSGLNFVPAMVGAFGTGTQIPSGAPEGTMIINIPPGDGQNGFFKWTFELPNGFNNVSLQGRANMDDSGRLFLNGQPVSPSIAEGGPNRITQFGDASFNINNPSLFRAGQNELILSDLNTGGGPSGGALYARVRFDASSPSLSAGGFLQNGFALIIQGIPGKNYIVQVSTDLREWSNLTTITLESFSQSFVDSQGSGVGNRFYRVQEID